MFYAVRCLLKDVCWHVTLNCRQVNENGGYIYLNTLAFVPALMGCLVASQIERKSRYTVLYISLKTLSYCA